MASPERVYQGSVRVFSVVFVLLGLANVIATFALGGSLRSQGVWLGIAFIAVGILRGWLGGGGLPWRRTKSEHMGEAAETGPAVTRPRG